MINWLLSLFRVSDCVELETHHPDIRQFQVVADSPFDAMNHKMIPPMDKDGVKTRECTSTDIKTLWLITVYYEPGELARARGLLR